MILILHMLLFSILGFSTPSWLEVKEVTVLPDQQIFNAWKEDIFSTQEFWAINDKEHFFEFLHKKGASPEVIKKLNQFYHPAAPHELLGTLYSFYENPRSVEVFYPVSKFKSKIPKPILAEIYSYLSSEKRLPLVLAFPSYQELKNEIKSMKLPRLLLKKTLHSIYKKNDMYFAPITPSLWPWIPAESRHYIVSKLTQSLNTDVALSVDIKIDKDTNLDRLSKLISGDRDPGYIKKLLQASRPSNIEKPVFIPLQELLHPFIQNKINSFHLTGGPNCYNCGINVHKGSNFTQEITYPDELKQSLEQHYIKTDKSNTSLQTGDLLLYKDKSGEFVHVSTYIVDNIVFTKNGVNKFSPYIFQTIEHNEKLYFSENDFELEVYRIKNNNNLVMCSSLFR